MGRRVCRHTSGRTKMVDINLRPGGEPEWTPVEDWWGDGYAVERHCEYGVCVEMCCPVCGCNRYGGFGLVECPCQDWIGFHEMRAKPPVAVKPSLRTNGRRRRKNRRMKK